MAHTSEEYVEQESTEIISPRVVELVERAEIDMQIATAKRYPRDLAVVKKKMLSFATLDEETAESCFYTLKRKDANGKTKLIQGPGVRLAEIAFSCYQNLRAAARIIDNDGRMITSQGVCHDLENNTLVSMAVQRRITTSRGVTYGDDMQVTTGNAANAIAFRNAVFKVIPGVLIKATYEAAKAVAIGTATTLSVKREKLFKRFDAMGVSAERVLKSLDKSSIENVDLADIEVLIGIGTAIKDGDQSIDDAFPEEPGSQKQADKVAADKITDLKKAGEILKDNQHSHSNLGSPGTGDYAEGSKQTATDSEHAHPVAGEATKPSSPPELKEPQHITELKVWRDTLGGKKFSDILGLHGYDKIEQVPAERVRGIVTEMGQAAADAAKE